MSILDQSKTTVALYMPHRGPYRRRVSIWECNAISQPPTYRSLLSSFCRIGNDILCHWISGPKTSDRSSDHWPLRNQHRYTTKRPAREKQRTFSTPSSASGTDNLWHINRASFRQIVSVAMKPSARKSNKLKPIKKAEDFSSASFRLVPSPRYFANSKLY